MLAGTAAAMGAALMNDRRLTPVLVEASPVPQRASASTAGAGAVVTFPDARSFLLRRLGIATLMAVAGVMAVAAIPAITTLAINLSTSDAAAVAHGPAMSARPASGVAGGFDSSYALAVPPADEVGSALMAAAQEQHMWDVMKSMRIIAEERAAQAAAEAAAAAERAATVRATAQPHSLNAPSGYAVGTVIHGARITIYGCTGPGGGFCNHMASGGVPFEGAAACSSNLPFGTRVRINGDPTGRIYECLDRGALAATWIDVFFYNTSDGIAWQSSLGSTIATIEIVN